MEKMHKTYSKEKQLYKKVDSEVGVNHFIIIFKYSTVSV